MFSKTAVFVATLSQALPALAIVHEKLAALPVGWTATSATDESSVVSLTVALTQQNIDQLESKLLAASTPGSSTCGRYLSDGELNTIFAPTAGASSAVESWLKR
jgi:tripeptidyl-peptidase-1